MPKLGEIRRSRELGYQNRGSHTWVACPECGKERWFKYRRDKINICRSCAYKHLGLNQRGEKSSTWKGGRHEFKGGYIGIKLQPNDPFYPMTNSEGYVLEHRLIMAKYLGRCLKQREIVHHIDDQRLNNSLSNLILFPSTAAHSAFHMKSQVES